MWWIIASGALVNFNLYALATFFPAFLTRYHGLSVGRRASGRALDTPWRGCGRRWSAGAWGDRVIRKRKDGRMLSGRTAALIAAPLALIGIPPAGRRRGGFDPPHHDGLRLPEHVLRLRICGHSRHCVARGTRHGHGRLFPGHVSVWRIFRTSFHGTTQRCLGAPCRPGRRRRQGGRTVSRHRPAPSHVRHPSDFAALALVLYAGSRTIAADMARRDEAGGRSVLQSAR